MILKHLFLRPEILSRLIFSTDGEAYYVQATSRQKARRALPEEIIRQLFVLSLLYDYRYPEGLIRLEFPIQMGREKKRADIAVLETSGNVKIIIEVKVEHDKDAMAQLISYMAITGAMYGAIISSTEIVCVKRISAQDVLPIDDLPYFLENDTWSEPAIQAVHNPQPSLSATAGDCIEVEGFERNTPTHAKITIKGHTLTLSNVELESYKRLRKIFLASGIALNPNIKQTEWFKQFSQLLENTPITKCLAIGASQGAVAQKIANAIEMERVGFRGGWISTHYLDALLREIGAERAVPRNKRRDMLRALGYAPHPGLEATDGRVNNPVAPEGVKSRLYIAAGHATERLREPARVAEAYTAAQGVAAVAASAATGPSAAQADTDSNPPRKAIGFSILRPPQALLAGEPNESHD